MVCHVCGDAASAQCWDCERYVCNTHNWSGGQCSACRESLNRRVEYRQSEEQRKIEESKCEFCGAADKVHLKCAVCGKFFCNRCGTITVLLGRHREGGSNDGHSWIRCNAHPQKKVFCPYPLLWLFSFGWPSTDPDQFEKPDKSWNRD
jgi:hypothetical protein